MMFISCALLIRQPDMNAPRSYPLSICESWRHSRRFGLFLLPPGAERQFLVGQVQRGGARVGGEQQLADSPLCSGPTTIRLI